VVVIATAANGQQAVQLSKEHHPDIIIMDVNMPEVDGLAAFKEISQIYPDTGCIIISAQKDSTTLSTAMALGAQEYLTKPFTIDELNDAVNRVGEQVEESLKKLAEADQLHKKTRSLPSNSWRTSMPNPSARTTRLWAFSSNWPRTPSASCTGCVRWQ
jgi:YesN/AraC family two-component response regulator